MKPLIRSQMTRRGFVRSVIGAFLGVASTLYPGLARVLGADGHAHASAATPVDLKDNSFWSGEVRSKGVDTLVLSSMEGTRTVRIPPGLTIWKEFDVSIDSVNVGDWVMAKGEPQSDGSLLARPGWVWVNAGRWDGTIAAVRPGGLSVKRHDGVERTVHFSRRHEVITAVKQLPVPEGVGALTVGLQIGSVGLVLPDRSLRATRTWIYQK